VPVSFGVFQALEAGGSPDFRFRGPIFRQQPDNGRDKAGKDLPGVVFL
jgi:hypothetical protein